MQLPALQEGVVPPQMAHEGPHALGLLLVSMQLLKQAFVPFPHLTQVPLPPETQMLLPTHCAPLEQPAKQLDVPLQMNGLHDVLVALPHLPFPSQTALLENMFVLLLQFG